MHRRRAKQPLVLAREVRGVAVPHAVPGAGRIEPLAKHEPPGFLEPQLLLELQRAHRRNGLKVLVEDREAHPQFTREILNAQRLGEVVSEPIDGLGNAVGGTAQDSHLPEPPTLCTPHQPVHNLAHDERGEKARIGGGLHQPDEPHHRVQQAHVQRAHVDRRHGNWLPWCQVACFDQHRADEGRIEREDDTQIGTRRRRLGDPGCNRQLNRGDEVVGRIVPVPLLAQEDLFASLGDHAEGRIRRAMAQRRGRRGADELEPRQRLRPPLIGNGTRDPRDQFVPARLRLLRVVCRPPGCRVHRNLVSRSCIILKMRTIIP